MYSIRTKLNLWFLLGIMVIFVAVFASLRMFQTEMLRQVQSVNEEALHEYIHTDWRSQTKALAAMTADMLVHPLYNDDFESIRDLAMVSVDKDMALCVFVVNGDGVILSDGTEEAKLMGMQYHADHLSHQPNTMLEKIDIDIGDTHLGTLYMQFDRSQSTRAIAAMHELGQIRYRKAQNSSDAWLLGLFVGALTFGAAGAYVVSRGLTRPLGTLSEAIEKVSRHEYDLNVPDQGDEIGELGRMLVKMGRDLKETTVTTSALEGTIAERTAELREKARELEAANERLMELDKLKSSLLSNVSHELRTPLTSVLGFARMLAADAQRIAKEAGENASGKFVDRIARNEEIVRHESKRLIRLINDILDLSKIEGGAFDWRDECVNIDKLMRNAIASVRGRLESYPGIDLRLILPDGPKPTLAIDEDKFHQALLNLLDNAVKFTESGVIEFILKDTTSHVVIEISDSGPGVPADERNMIFDRFYQAKGDLLSDKPQGTGIGLSICREVVQRYCGTIVVEENERGGARFVITLPKNLLEACPQPLS